MSSSNQFSQKNHKPAAPFVPKPVKLRRMALCHPNRVHHAHDKCQACYELERHPPKRTKKVALCHPERAHLAKGMCSECYWRDRYQNEPGFRERVLAYQKEYRRKYGSAP